MVEGIIVTRAEKEVVNIEVPSTAVLENGFVTTAKSLVTSTATAGHECETNSPKASLRVTNHVKIDAQTDVPVLGQTVAATIELKETQMLVTITIVIMLAGVSPVHRMAFRAVDILEKIARRRALLMPVMMKTFRD